MMVGLQQANAATFDATGEWNFSTSNHVFVAGTNCEDNETLVSTATIDQAQDDTVTMIIQDDEGGLAFTGTVTDATYDLTTEFEEEGATITVQVTFTLSDPDTGTGEVVTMIDDGVTPCTSEFDLAMVKEGTPAAYDASGDWNYTTSENFVIEGFACDPDEPETGTITITQDDPDVTMVVEDDAGDLVFTGTVSGAFYTLEATYDDEGDTVTTTVIFELTSDSSGTGQLLYSIFTGQTEICRGGATLALSRPGSGGSSGCFISTAVPGL
jgi:hypothetical protein